ncbi:HTTM domain-containing protein [Ponticaulis sp.]|uniref:HTTM domain-containing protein n=1 Tax=Ponticaulis sp. TaxID=2020902 RepID=UPI000C54D44E|nr:HTTM domain-containing protein [Ponticaulis sp.]MBN04016.1 hypothetical protein [Ponticaulis sp.]|tara:strand:- start:1125 stop:1817 length:693 start_codon:yes stop_codon:yes gene_type:complete
MTLDLAMRWTEILLAIALIMPSVEHIRAGGKERLLFSLRLILCLLLLYPEIGAYSAYICLAMSGLAVLILHRFEGPYNGGSDRMSLLILFCLTLAHWLPQENWKELAFGYLGLQLTLSYFISGWVKIRNPDWRTGRALRDVFAFSAYPVAENLRGLADRKTLLLAGSWLVMICELLFPLSLASKYTLIPFLVLAASFHLSNAMFFGLNRFVLAWIAAYPSILWLQDRFIG